MQQRDKALIARVVRMSVDDIAEVFRTGNVADNPFLHGEVGEELSHRLRKALDEETAQRVAARAGRHDRRRPAAP